MDWGLGNPNKTAALIAMLLVAVWGLAYIRRWGFWVALTLFAGLGICLVHTLSRGGLFAAGAGLVCLLWQTPRPWPKARVIGLVAAVWVIVGFSIYIQAHKRLGKGVVEQDRSISNRLEVWKDAPRMMLDAPAGWGFGNAGDAYVQWYQPVERNETYRTLVNSHLTWLVEGGWLFRFLYIAGWLSAFALCWPLSETRRWLSVPFGTWMAFAVAATFSSVAESIWLWIVPATGLLLAMLARAQTRCWPALKAGISVGVFSVAALVLIAVSGWMTDQEIDIVGSPDRVMIGGTKPGLWITTNEKTFGARYGKTLRGFLLEHTNPSTAIGVVKSVSQIPKGNEATIVLAGEQTASTLSQLQAMPHSKLLLLNPAFYPQDAGIGSFDKTNIRVLFGDFSQSPARSAWAGVARVVLVEGAGDFLPSWPELVIDPPSRASL